MMIRVSKDLLGIGCGTSAKNLSPSKKDTKDRYIVDYKRQQIQEIFQQKS